MTEVKPEGIPAPDEQPQAAVKIELDKLRVGLIIGVDDQNNLFFNNVGHGQASMMELVGLAQTAMDMVRFMRDKNIPSLRRQIGLMAFQGVVANNNCQCKGECQT